MEYRFQMKGGMYHNVTDRRLKVSPDWVPEIGHSIYVDNCWFKVVDIVHKFNEDDLQYNGTDIIIE